MSTQTRSWTIAGLLIALFGLPAIVGSYNALVVDRTDANIAFREIAILALTAFLLWIVVNKERLPLSSIGIRWNGIGRSIAWGLGVSFVIFAALFAILITYSALGIHYGEGAVIAPSMWVTLLTVIRAGISEEIFYRGFALERLESLSGSKWLAAAVVIIGFAGFHYRQGWAGVFIALILGAILTGFYLWKRNLIAAMFAHLLVDFIPNLLLPMLAGNDAS